MSIPLVFPVLLKSNIILSCLRNPVRQFANATSPVGYYPWFKQAVDNFDSGVKISNEENQYKIAINVQNFLPNEITVKTVNDNTVVVEAKHESKPDETGYIFRHFTRKYIIPPGHDVKNIVSSLTQDGILTVTAPKPFTDLKGSEKGIPIQIPPSPTEKSSLKKPSK